MPYNLLTCSGFGQAGGWVASGACMKARLGLVILFFLIAIIRKWGGEEMGIGFSLLFSLLIGLPVYVIVVTLSGSFKIAFIIGMVAALVAGYGFGVVFGGSEDSGGGYE